MNKSSECQVPRAALFTGQKFGFQPTDGRARRKGGLKKRRKAAKQKPVISLVTGRQNVGYAVVGNKNRVLLACRLGAPAARANKNMRLCGRLLRFIELNYFFIAGPAEMRLIRLVVMIILWPNGDWI